MPTTDIERVVALVEYDRAELPVWLASCRRGIGVCNGVPWRRWNAPFPSVKNPWQKHGRRKNISALLSALKINLNPLEIMKTFPCGLILAASLFSLPAQSPGPDSFNPGASGDRADEYPYYSVNCLVVQADGKILAGGTFTNLAGQDRNYIGRLNADGSVDPAFNPGANNSVFSLAVQADGKILVAGEFTTLAGQGRNYLGRLNADGSLDSAFNPGVIDGNLGGPLVCSLVVQADGKILVAGGFTTLGGQNRDHLGRLNADGSLDTAFNPGSCGPSNISSVVAQPDGKILVGGVFLTLAGQPRSYLGRLNADGSLDAAFNPGANGSVLSLTLQADGKILAGGTFGILGGQGRSYIARLNADGSLDTTFNPGANGPVYSMAVQADGKILVAGDFTLLGGQTRKRMGRLNADGTLDPLFNPGANHSVVSLAMQADGKILVGGAFTNLAGQPRRALGRLNATEPATQTLEYNGSTITWLRAGTSPEVGQTIFEYSTDGSTWTSLGAGTRGAGGWRRSNVSLPPHSTVRARGDVIGGLHNGSGWFMESTMVIEAPPVILAQPVGLTHLYGTAATLSVGGGGSSPLSCQWRRDGTNLNDGGNITGAQTALLSLRNVFGADAGDYSVVLSNAWGLVTSQVARLAILDPAILSAPANLAVLSGLNASFNVVAAGTAPLSYQWLRDDVPLVGAVAATCTLTNVRTTDAGVYRVIVSNAFGTATSAGATLTVSGTGGSSLYYQNPPGGWAYIYTGDAATGAPRQQNQFALDGTWRHENGSSEWNGDRRGLENPPAGGVESTNGVLTIEDAINVTSGANNNRKIYFTHALTQDGVADVNLLDTGVTLSFRARLTPADGRQEIALPDGYGIFSGGKGMFGVRQSTPSSIISFSLVRAAEDGDSANSLAFSSAGLTMNRLNGDAPNTTTTILQGANSSSIPAENPLVPLDPTVFHEFWITIQANDATPGNGTHTVNVYVDGALVPTPFNVTAATGADVDTTVTPNWTDYIAMGLNNSPTLGAFDVDFCAYKPGVLTPRRLQIPPLLTASPQSQTVVLGATATFSAAATGEPPLLYQWFFNETVALADATNATLILDPVQVSQAGAYHLVVSNLAGSATSAVGTLTVAITPLIAAQPQNQACWAGATVSFSAGIIGIEPLTYQWFFNGPSPVPGATTATLTLSNLQNDLAGAYHLVVSNGYGGATSGVATLQIFSLADLLDNPSLTWSNDGHSAWVWETNVTHDGIDAAASGSITHNEQSILETTVTGPAMVSFWWKVSSQTNADYLKFYVGSNRLAQISGEAGWTEGLYPVPTGPHVLRWMYAKDGGGSAGLDRGWLEEVTVVPITAPLITSQPQSQAVAVGSNATFSVSAIGLEPLAYQWWFNDNVPLAGANQATLTVSNVQSAHLGRYAVVVSNLDGAATSQAARLQFLAQPTIVQVPQSQTVLAGNDATFTVVITNNATLPVTNQWRKANTILTNIVSDDYTCSFTLYNVSTHVTLTNGPGNYRVVIQNEARPAPGGIASTYFALSVANPPPPLAATLPPANVSGTAATLNGTVNPKGGRTTAWFEYGLTTAYGSATEAANVGQATNEVSFSVPIAGLTPNTNYHYRLVATNYGGGAVGEDQSFSTPFQVPRPAMSQWLILANGQFRFSFTGPPGLAYQVLASTNLFILAPIGTAMEITPGQYEFTDPDAPTLPHRFYQLRAP